jgi:iron complex outermembrane receptor protein
VRAADGGPLGAALVTARNASSGALRSVTTRDDGRYVIPGLAQGGYTVTASLIGYRRAVRADVRVDGEATVDFSLETLPLQQVVVTATLREQTLEDVPFSIAAPTASVLRERGAENLEAVAANVAGFTVQNLGPGQNTVAVRGASAGQIARDQPGVKEQVGAYLDDVPISLSLFTPDLDLFDVSRVEVLRGPQGTLFGAGSLSGTVRYITNQPELGVRSTFGEVGANSVIGGGAGAVAKLGANVPLGERAAARVAGWFNRLPGFMDAVQPGLSVNENVNAGSRAGGRAALRLAPTDALTITPRVAFQAARADGWNRIDAFNILANPYTTTRPAVTLGARQQFTQIEEPFSDDFLVGDVNVRYDFGPAALTSVTSLTRRDVRVVRDAGALTSSITGGSIGLPERVYSLDAPLDDQTDSRVLTQELRLAGGGGRARWLAGASSATTGASTRSASPWPASSPRPASPRGGSARPATSCSTPTSPTTCGRRRCSARPPSRCCRASTSRAGCATTASTRTASRSSTGSSATTTTGSRWCRRRLHQGRRPRPARHRQLPRHRRPDLQRAGGARLPPRRDQRPAQRFPSAPPRTWRRSAGATRGARRRRGTTRWAPRRASSAGAGRSTCRRSTWTSATCR